MEKIKSLYRNSGVGRVAAICQTKDVVSFLKNPIRTYCLYNYYRFLTEYCKYDKVWIMSNVPSTDPDEHICKNMLKDLPIIWGTSEKHILEKHGVNDVIMQCTPPNFYGGVTWVFTPYNINRITEWYQASKGTDNKLYYVQDDPLFPNPDIPGMVVRRLLDMGNLKIAYNKKYPAEIVDKEVEYMKSIRPQIDECFKDVIIAFCGIDYEKFWMSMKEKSRPNVNKWDNFNCYIWNGVNDNLDVKLKDYDWGDKKYDAEYHGVAKSGKRTKVTESYYSALTNKFMHIVGRSPFFKNLNEENFDKYDVTEYYDLLQLVAANAKSAFITHEDNILGNQISPRYFDCMLSDIIAFVDVRYDPEKKLTDNDELKEFMYVSSPKEFAEKVDKIANDKEFYKHIKYLQRKSIFDNFRDFIEEENIHKYETILNK